MAVVVMWLCYAPHLLTLVLFVFAAQVGRMPEGDDPRFCRLCGAPCVERHCKIVCTRCGFTRDCSDPSH